MTTVGPEARLPVALFLAAAIFVAACGEAAPAPSTAALEGRVAALEAELAAVRKEMSLFGVSIPALRARLLRHIETYESAATPGPTPKPPAPAPSVSTVAPGLSAADAALLRHLAAEVSALRAELEELRGAQGGKPSAEFRTD